ncbi:hypothetical protein DPMN_094787 [Dreissena polymorpha]|uniref:B box-type domain-containing protein n=2 Tax=Dreissena polymorpha TaxID=45954 RepID=A0A9D4R293_DREPO|nr:hypothetical protein DPMN_094787 [Dreissena polymorpha]
MGEKDVWPANESNPGLEKCYQHPDKDIELFCEDHSRLCCLLCQFNDHRSCERVVFVAKKEKGFLPTADIETITANIERQLIHVREMMSFRDKNNTSSQESYEKTSEDIKALRKNFEEMFDKIEKNTMRDLDRKMGELQDTLKSDMANLSQLDANLKRLNSAVSNQKRKGDPLTFMMEMKYMEIMHISEIILDDLDESNDAAITFECNTEIGSVVGQFLTFGEFFLSKNPSMNTEIYASCRESEEHGIKMSHERVCDIRGICELSNGTLVIADRKNSSIKVLDNNYHVVNCMALSFPPNDICCVSSTKVAVAVNSMNGGQILIINITTKNVTVENTYEFKHKCNGIITSSEYSLFITTNTALLHYKMNAAMEFIGTIHEDTSSFLTVNKCAKRTNRQKVYVTNYNHNQVLEISRNGTKEVLHVDYDLVNPTGVHVTELGQVLVCNSSSNTVLMIDGQGHGTVLADMMDGVKHPQSVYYSKMRGEIVVGQSCNRLLVIKNCI